MTSLVVVDSEKKAKILQAQSGEMYDILLLRSVPMRIVHNAKDTRLHTGQSGFKFVPTEKEKESAKKLLANLAGDIYLALDSDLRGELWSWMLAKFLISAGKGVKGARRVHVSGYVEDEINRSFQQIEPIQEDRAASFYIRSLFDSCLIRHLKRLLGTTSGPSGLALHYTSLTALFLLEERQAEIASFSAPLKWQIKVRLTGPSGDFMTRLVEAFGISDDGQMKDPGQLKEAQALFEGQPFTVKDVEQTDFSIDPPMPYRLPELLHDGYTLLGMGPLGVLRALQKLFAGVKVDGKLMGMISSPFSIVSKVSDMAVDKIRKGVESLFGQEQLVERELDTSFILPLIPELTAEDVSEALSREEGELYELLRRRALASQMRAAVGKSYLVTCSSGKCLFQGRAPGLSQKGFLQIFQAGYDPELLQECRLASLEVGLNLKSEQIIPEQISSSESEYYTFESLFDDLQDFSAPAEAPLISLLQEMMDKDYLQINGDGGFLFQDKGVKVIKTLNRAFPGMMGINLSAYFEQTVNEVVSGRKSLDFALKQFDQNFVMHGVPLVKVHVPKAVPVRQKRSKNIIKSPDPAVVKEVQKEPVAPEEQASTAVDEPLGEKVEDMAVEEVSSPQVMEEPAGVGAESEEAGQEDVLLEETAGEGEPDAQEDLSAGEEPEQEDFVDQAGDEEVEHEEFAAPAVEDGQEIKTDQQEEEVRAVFEADVADASPVQEEATSRDAGDHAPEVPDEKVREAGKICPECGRPLLLKSDRFGKFLACSGYPSCRHSESHSTEHDRVDVVCPICQAESLVVKRTATGKKLYVCPAADCEFMAWSKPHAVRCPSCASPFLVEKKKAPGEVVLRCPKAGCSYQQLFDKAVEGGGGAEEAPAPKKKKVLVRRKKGSSGGGKKKKVVVRRKK